MQIQTDFKNCIIENKIKLVFAHNLGYDLANVFGKSYVNYQPILRHGSVLQIKYLHRHGVTYFRDSVALLKSSIKDIGKELGLHKIETDNFTDLDYCERDVDILILALEKLFEVLKQNKIPLKLTLPSIYHSYFRTKIKKPIFKSDYIEFVRYCYKGGRSEAFKIGKVNNIKVYDINSLFPYIMLNYKMPEPKKCFREDKLIDPKDGFQILNCIIKQDTYIPPLGIKHHGKLIFANGITKGFFTNEELFYLIQNDFGELIKIQAGLVFDWKGKIFAQTIKELYDLRLKYFDSYQNKIVKFIMNGGYGKYGQSNIIESYDRIQDLIIQETGEYPAQSNYIWPIVITSNARLILHKFMQKFSSNLVYVDTDSLHLTNSNKFVRLSDKIGGWKLEGEFNWGEYKNAKCYKLVKGGNKITYKVKGVPKAYQKEFFETGKVTFKKPVKLKTNLRNPEHILNFWEYLTKEMKSGYDKRTVYPDGSTTALELNYFNELEQAKKDFEIKQSNQMKFKSRKEVSRIFRNTCYCGQIISDWDHFCETHNPNNFNF